MDIVKMAEEFPKIKNWLDQNNIDSIWFDVIYDDTITVNLSKRANGRLWRIKHTFNTFVIDLDIIGDYLEDMAKELNDDAKKTEEDSK